jgi:hypothetical protein
MNAIVLLTVTPTQKTINFFQKLKKRNYDLYICVDDNDYICVMCNFILRI